MTRRETGLVHIYCGDGKGKTTAAVGLCMRAAGFGYRVLIYQFMKDNGSSERKALLQVQGITLMDGPRQEKFSFRMTPEEKEQCRLFNDSQLQMVSEMAVSGGYDVLFLDEVLYAIRAGLLDEEKLVAFLDGKPACLEVILTGRDPGERLMERADYISEIRKVKHPFDHGERARKGIEL